MVHVSATESSTQIRCVECHTLAMGAAGGWKAYVGGGYEGEPLEVIIYCPACARRECED